ncbi:MAG: hypothetical protein ICV68_00825 [Pyrinomonadaceae bacterium]|nr:hypothetical protein [Pyrinomonadaceae bacterium]
MATKKAAKKRSTKGGTSKKAGSKKAATKSSKKSAASLGKCSGWKAWHDFMPLGTPTLYVTGKCRFPKHGFKVTLKKAVPQGINRAILLLRKVVKPPTGPVIQTPEVVDVRYELKTRTRYTHVTILPDGVTVRVQIVS